MRKQENQNREQKIPNISYKLHVMQAHSVLEKDEWLKLTFLMVSCGTVKKSIELSEKLWEKRQTLSIICIVSEPEEVFGALPYPFFHIVRAYALEQDLNAVLKKMERMPRKKNEWQFFQCKNNKNDMVRVKTKEIMYIESNRHEIQIHLERNIFENGRRKMSREVIFTTETLTQCEEKLKFDHFVRIHKSYLVNCYHIEKMERDKVILDNGEVLYMSRARYAEVKYQFEQYIRHAEFL